MPVLSDVWLKKAMAGGHLVGVWLSLTRIFVYQSTDGGFQLNRSAVYTNFSTAALTPANLVKNPYKQ